MISAKNYFISKLQNVSVSTDPCSPTDTKHTQFVSELTLKTKQNKRASYSFYDKQTTIVSSPETQWYAHCYDSHRKHLNVPCAALSYKDFGEMFRYHSLSAVCTE